MKSWYFDTTIAKRKPCARRIHQPAEHQRRGDEPGEHQTAQPQLLAHVILRDHREHERHEKREENEQDEMAPQNGHH
jgi:hypothetical protein